MIPNTDTKKYIKRRHHLIKKSTVLSAKKSSFYSDKTTLRFLFMIALVGTYLVVELVCGIIFKSLALIADSLHMITDLIALIIGFFCFRISKRERTERATFGFSRMEEIGGLMNSCFLIAVALTITLEAIQKFIENEDNTTLEKNSISLIIVAGVGLLINLVGLIVFGMHSHGDGHSHSHSSNEHKKKKGILGRINLNILGVMLHMMGDFMGSVAVMVSGSIIAFTKLPNRTLADPICSLIIAMLIMGTSVPIVKRAISILLEKVPSEIDLGEIKQSFLALPNVEEIHELHVWQLSRNKSIGFCHVIMNSPSDFMKVCDAMKDIFHKRGIHSTSIQPEFHAEVANSKMADEEKCYDKVCDGEDCFKNTCCGEEGAKFKSSFIIKEEENKNGK